MASLNGWIFIVIGLAVGVWSYFDYNLRFFIYVGGAIIVYGVGKLLITKVNNPATDKGGNLGQAPVHHNVTASQHLTSGHVAHAQHNGQVGQQLHQSRVGVNPSRGQQYFGNHPGHSPNAAGHGQPTIQTVAHPHQQNHAGHNASTQSSHMAYRVCPNCKRQIHQSYRFCPHCGWGV